MIQSVLDWIDLLQLQAPFHLRLQFLQQLFAADRIFEQQLRHLHLTASTNSRSSPYSTRCACDYNNFVLNTHLFFAPLRFTLCNKYRKTKYPIKDQIIARTLTMIATSIPAAEPSINCSVTMICAASKIPTLAGKIILAHVSCFQYGLHVPELNKIQGITNDRKNKSCFDNRIKIAYKIQEQNRQKLAWIQTSELKDAFFGAFQRMKVMLYRCISEI